MTLEEIYDEPPQIGDIWRYDWYDFRTDKEVQHQYQHYLLIGVDDDRVQTFQTICLETCHVGRMIFQEFYKHQWSKVA